MQKLAIEGGKRARSNPDRERVMRVGALQIGDAEQIAVDQVIRRQILYRYHGSTVSEFETSFSQWLGRNQHRCLAVNSGSSALLLAFAVLNLQPGDEVLLPTVGFISAVTAVIAAGGVPCFVPVDESLGMDPEMAASLVTDRTRALLAVHPYGAPCNLAALQAVVDRFGGTLIEDVAQACGAEFNGRRVGTFGDLACFSFQYFKPLTTGEGGMIVTRDENFFDQLMFMHDAAATWTTPERAARVNQVSFPPLNLRMSELEGALGLAQLERYDDVLSRLKTIRSVLHNMLSQRAQIFLRPLADKEGDIGTFLIFYLNDAATAEWVTAALQAEGVGAALLRGQPGYNRHWVVDWLPILSKIGFHDELTSPPFVGPRRLEDGICFPIDPRYSNQDVEETLMAFHNVLDAVGY
jgi:8-amino-3,8-dideoxy-alpha-D-manno-octulosonate transaminase